MSDSATHRAQSDAPLEELRPSPLFWLAMGTGWGVLTALGMVLPVMGRLSSRPNFLLNMLGYALATVAMICASALLSLIICRYRLPAVWWMHRVVGRKVNEFQGLYFVGGNIKGLSSDVHNAVFSAEDHMSRWDITFGLITLALTIPHALAAIYSRSVLVSMYFNT